jgi:hypothetical protein
MPFPLILVLAGSCAFAVAGGFLWLEGHAR